LINLFDPEWQVEVRRESAAKQTVLGPECLHDGQRCRAKSARPSVST